MLVQLPGGDAQARQLLHQAFGYRVEALAYAYQFHQVGNAPVYTLDNFALVDASKQTNKGVEWVDIDGPNGPVELEKAHLSLANIVLGVRACFKSLL